LVENFLSPFGEQGASQHLFFAVDPLGRRSLLIHKPSSANPYFLLSSVSAGSNPLYEFDEVLTESIYYLDIQRLRAAKNVRPPGIVYSKSRQTVFLCYRSHLPLKLVCPHYPGIDTTCRLLHRFLMSVHAFVRCFGELTLENPF